ncbi:transcriptional regulator [Nonlabens spongiae]|uniref:Transcriptional regulator n=1 Tax=Nonlabens spongiae TaxID=331648 RepID=A0A1W6MIP4_9FLAO|nr:transcriptional regulator [Nonlabens spongiae]ARN77484.1 transcriptional regulator [Nonlabens spongiae]
MKNLQQKKLALVEKLGVFFEKKKDMAPVASRIFAFIILTGKQGTTFDDLVTKLCASKSTISTHLNHLQDLKKISYFTKTGDRKKYFIHNKETMVQDLGNIVLEWKNEKHLHIEIMDYKKELNLSSNDDIKFELRLHENFIEFLDGAISSVTKLKNTISERF